MNPKWKKIALITAPILVAGSVYAFTNASASNEDNGITGTLVASQTLTPEEIAALEAAKPAPAPETSTTTEPSVDMESINPFTVYTPPAASSDTATAPAATTPAPAPTPETAKQPFSLENVAKLELKSQTTMGELKLEFKSEKGEVKLEGQVGDRKIEVKGEQALDVLNKLLASLGLQDSMTALLQGEDVKLDAALAGALKGLEIELKDGRKIETKQPPGKGNNPKAQGKHDNGNHYGQDKAKKEKENKGNGKAKGKDKKDDHGDND